jgi:NCS1 family nucleobase:cation symporter-1
MATTSATESVLARLDQLNEFERQPVTAAKLHGPGYFAAVYSGEHIAATEFVIGALFVKLGAGAFDILVGLLLGNLLAVLSWAYVCAPIAVQTRLTLYWYLRKIGGPAVMVTYNVLNALLHCILAGAMITVSASAVRIPFGIGAETRWFPQHLSFVFVVLSVGTVVVTLAVLGFKRLAQFASICSPWMVLMFVAGALMVLPLLGSIHSLSDLWQIAQLKIWTGTSASQAGGIGFWHIVAFGWICNLATHIGLSDMAIFRYARRASYGFCSAFGMYLGHYLSWICAGVMGAAAALVLNRPLADIDSGGIGHHALGAMGALCVVIAGWTTANPTLYRAGLAFQAVTPHWSRGRVTLAIGALTTVVACFPFVFTSLLGFVSLYGLLLMPVGAIVVVEHWLFPRIGMTRYWATREGRNLNWPALVAWGVALAVALVCWTTGVLHEFFLAFPVWFLTAVLYIGLAAMAGARRADPGNPEESDDAAVEETLSEADKGGQAAPGTCETNGTPERDLLYYVSGGIALMCLCLCLVLPVFVFASSYAGAEVFQGNRSVLEHFLTWISLTYFVAATVWLGRREQYNRQVEQGV